VAVNNYLAVGPSDAKTSAIRLLLLLRRAATTTAIATGQTNRAQNRLAPAFYI